MTQQALQNKTDRLINLKSIGYVHHHQSNRQDMHKGDRRVS
jgi:hypothetical protein